MPSESATRNSSPIYLNREKSPRNPLSGKNSPSYWNENNGETLVVLSNLNGRPLFGRMGFQGGFSPENQDQGRSHEIS